MKYQTRSYTCGPAAVVNALRLFGVEVPEAQVAKAAGTTSEDGTGVRGLKRALKGLGCAAAPVRTWRKLMRLVRSGTPVILHLDDELHWVLVLGCLGDRLIIFDSQRSKSNTAENGVRVLDGSGLKGACYGISLVVPVIA